MRRLIPLLLLALVCAIPTAHAAREATWVSYPALSPDGTQLYFTAWGDIWCAPVDGSYMAWQLTNNVAYDGRPVVSPDGSQVAFVSDRFGNYDVFLMPADGGEATRLTWESATNYVGDWRPDGGAVLEYGSHQDLWATTLYELPLDGSAERRLSGPDHNDHVFPCYLGQDASQIVYSRGPGDWARKHYRGPTNYTLWHFNSTTGLHAPLTSHHGNDMWPQSSPDGREVYYVSDMDGTDNIWVLDMGSGEQRQLTHFSGDGPRWPRISASGNRLVFTVFGEPYVLDLPGGEPLPVRITFPGDPKTEQKLALDKRDGISEYVLSPNGNYFAFINMGDVYVLKNPDVYPEDAKPDQDLSRAFRITRTPERELHLSWSPDSKTLGYISDRHGQFDVFTCDLATTTETRITETPAEEWLPQFAPQGDKLAYYSGNRRLQVYDTKTKAEKTLAEGRLRSGPYVMGYEWAPDGVWMSYTMTTLDWIPDIFLANVDSGETVNVSATPDWNSSATFSPDGKYLAWIESGEAAQEIMLLELYPRERRYDVAVLFEDDRPKADAKAADDKEDDDESDDAEKDEEGKKDAESKDEPKLRPPLRVDTDRIHLRAQPITSMQGSAGNPQFDPTSKFILFSTNHAGSEEWWSVTIDGHEYKQITAADGRGSPEWSPKGDKLYFLHNGALAFMNMNGAQPGNGGGSVPTTARIDHDQYAIWDQMLQEGWRQLRDGFYDPRLHGHDWDAVLARYRPRVQELGTTDEFAQLMREMLGELNASHLGYYPSGGGTGIPSDTTADFGVDYDESHAGDGWRVAKVISDGPSDIAGSRLFVGDMILAVNGERVTPQTNRARLLRNIEGVPAVLTVRSSAAAVEMLRREEQTRLASLTEEQRKALPADPLAHLRSRYPTGDGERLVLISPSNIHAMRQLRYEQWVADNRAKVYSACDGRIGYQHIQGMNRRSLEQFRRELFTESRGKDALIIDVRFNGGGNIHEQLVDILDRRSFGYAQFRDDERVVQPALRWEGPIVVLINGRSYSDAEIFPHIMQKLGLATIMGEATGGHVIGTYNFQLLDGSVFRMPSRGWWLPDDINMEGYGAQPDIWVHLNPMAVAQGGDNQLDAAVEHLLGKL